MTVEALEYRPLSVPPNPGSACPSPWTTLETPPSVPVDERGHHMTPYYNPREEEHPYNQRHRRNSCGCPGPQTCYNVWGQKGVLSLITEPFVYTVYYAWHRTAGLLVVDIYNLAHTGSVEPSLLVVVIFLGDGSVS